MDKQNKNVATSTSTPAKAPTQVWILKQKDLASARNKFYEYKENHKDKELFPIIFQYNGKVDRYKICQKVSKYIICIAYAQSSFIFVCHNLQIWMKRKCQIPSQQRFTFLSKGTKNFFDYQKRSLPELFKDQQSDGFLHFQYLPRDQLFVPNCQIPFFVIPLILVAVPTFLVYITAKTVVEQSVNAIKSIPYPGKYSAKSKYKEKFPLEQRIQKYKKIKQKNENLVPIVIQKHQLSNLREINPTFAVESSLSFQNCCLQIQQKIFDQSEGKDNAKESVYFYIKGSLPSPNMLMKEIDQKYHDSDGFIYITYQEQESY